jgi:hypothetical protein
MLYEKRQAVNAMFLYGILRQINSQVRQFNCEIDEEIFDHLKEYIDVQKPATENKKGKKKEQDPAPSPERDPEEPVDLSPIQKTIEQEVNNLEEEEEDEEFVDEEEDLEED